MSSPNENGVYSAGPLLTTAESEPRRLPREHLYNLLLLGIVFLAAIPRLYLGATQFVEYDGYWNIFIAQQDRLQNFLFEYQSNAHPPLYYLVLKLSLWFGHSPLVYRSVSLITGLAAISFIERIASKMMRWRPAPLLTALAFGLALPGIVISVEVRQYMLCIFFLLISYSFFLDFARETTVGSFRPRALFAITATLACLSHYCAVLYVAAVLFLSAACVILRRSEPIWRGTLREIATFGPVIAITSCEYFWHFFGVLSNPWNHLPGFYYEKGRETSVREFLFRNLQNNFNLFSPWPVQNRTVFLAIMFGLLFAASVLAYRLRRFREPKNLPALWTMVVTSIMVVELMVASILSIYPFGGFLRQQFFLFPFLILCALLMVDRMALAIPRRAATVLAVFLAIATVAVSAQGFRSYPKIPAVVRAGGMELYDRVFPNPEGVYLDQYNLIVFFIHHDKWKWEFVEPAPLSSSVSIYRLTRGGRQMFVCRDKERWLLDFTDAPLYGDLEACLRGAGLSSLTIFRVAQLPGAAIRTANEIAAFRKQVSDASTARGMCVQTLVLRNYDIYAEMRAHGCKEETPSAETAEKGLEVDDVNPIIAYQGLWESGHYPGAMNDTLSFSNQPGASALLVFRGTSIQYVYTKAYNRGKARVSIDGSERAVIDLFAGNVMWRSSTTFDDLAPGTHTIEITVLGTRSPQSQDVYVDVDALIPR